MKNKQRLRRGLSLFLAGALTVTTFMNAGGLSAAAANKEKMSYDDVSSNDWFYNYVSDVYEKNLMTGLDDDTFGPNQTLVRGQFATILYRMEKKPKVTFSQMFGDVSDGQFYTDPVLWAASKDVKVVTGYSNGNFGPNDSITREQMALMMYRYAKYKNIDTTGKAALTDYPDGNSVSEYAQTAMAWCVSEKIISGQGTGVKYLNPQGPTTRAECATIISRYAKLNEQTPDNPDQPDQPDNPDNPNPPAAPEDKQELQELVDDYADVQESTYTADTWAAFAAAREAANKVLNSATSTKEEVEKALAELEKAVENLTFAPPATPAPAKDDVIPDANQYQYQKEELAAFCHFGPNTFNEVEWGEQYGSRTPAQIFTLSQDFDADTLVSTLKEAGFQKLIVTAKHHDGFCIWASEYTTYDVAASNYKNGGGDILAEISEACTKYDMDMGLYLSPWDIHEPSYGYYDENHKATTKDKDVLDYNEYYDNQLEEILGNDKYGNDGHFTEVWMDGAKGSGANAQDYDFERWFATIQKNEGKEAGFAADCMLFGAQAYTTVRWIGNENGYAAEETWAKSNVDKEKNTIDSRTSNGYTMGYEDGNQWTVPEADARITSGWFWGTTKNTPKSISDLAGMYFGSVGHNSTFLLNVPPNNKGSVDDAILARVREFGQEVRDTFASNLAKRAKATASETRGNEAAYGPANVLDGKDDTYWTVNDNTSEGSIVIDMGGQKLFDVVSIEESIEFGQRIKSFKVEYRGSDTDEWKTFDQGTTIGAKRLCRKAAVRASQIKITVTTSGKVPMLSEVGVYKASQGFELTSSAPAGIDVIDITDDDFQFTGSWKNETGAQYTNNTNIYSTAQGDSCTLNFTGSKVYLIGTLDPNHGSATVYIDDKEVQTLNMNKSPRAVGQILFESDESLSDGSHVLKLVTTTKAATGIEAAYVINNGGKGMVGLEQSAYTMNENETISVKLKRVGGTKGSVTVTVSPNPGTAIQDDFDTEKITKVTFAEGQSEATAEVTTRRNTNKTGDRRFSIELSTDSDGLILGFNSRAYITIRDTESNGATPDPEPDKPAGNEFTEANPFKFPAKVGEKVSMEAENMHLNNTGENEEWPLMVSEAAWASGGKFVNAMNTSDSATLYYTAEKAGTFTVTVTFRSGDSANSFSWSGTNIENDSVTAGADDKAGETHTATFTIKVTKAGAGAITFLAGEKNAPQLDKFDFEFTAE